MDFSGSDANPRRRRPYLAACESFVAVSAIGGAFALTSGTVNMGPSVTQRLPGSSPVFGGIALAVTVGVPMSIATIAEWRASSRADLISLAAGTVLVGWIVVEMATIRTFSWLQPAFGLVGAGIALAGWRGLASHSDAASQLAP